MEVELIILVVVEILPQNHNFIKPIKANILNFMNKIILAIFFLPIFLFSQNKIQGIVLDSKSKEPLAFANITFNANPKLNVTTDIDGKFNFKSNDELQKLICTYVGYEKLEINDLTNSNEIQIILNPISNSLDEVVINKNNNPANRIIKKVIENKEMNNPENISTFQYKSYNKNVYDIIYNSCKKNDSLKINKFLKNGHVFLTESISNRTYIKPDITEIVIVASKTSGFKNFKFATIETDMQPFSFYDENIKLLEKNYLNPISNGSLNKYYFKLEEEIIKTNDTIFVISYKPKKNKNFDGLKGLLYINSNKYAIQNVIASPFEKGSVNLKIQQQYQLIEKEYWFPEKLNYELDFGEDKKSTNTGISVNGKSYISDVILNISINKKNIMNNITLADNSNKRSARFWDNNRVEILNQKEILTYNTIDSLGKKYNFDRKMLIMEKIIQNKYPSKYFDIDLSKSFIYNQFEGYRLGTGIVSNDYYSRTMFKSSAYIGYGIKDKLLKHGATFYHIISKTNGMEIGFEYKNDLVENGFFETTSNNEIFYFRNIIGYSFNKINENKFNFIFKPIKYLSGNLSYQHRNINTVEIDNKDSFKETSFSLNLRYAFNEKITNTFGKEIRLESKYPTLNFHLTKGFKNLVSGDLDFERIQASIFQTFYTKNLGKTTYFIDAGLITKIIPSRFLFTGEGSNFSNNFFNFYSSNNFQTMFPYEFLSDKYVNLFLSHDFGSLLFKAKKFKPSFIFHNNIGWGSLSNNNNVVNAKTKDKIYLETGLQLNNLVKIKMDNLGYLGIGFGGFFRYGYYSYTDFKQNSVFKMTLKYTIN